MLEQSLSKLNFTPNEIKIYSALFEIGKCRAGKIIETTGMHRNLVYVALESLEARNLVTKVLIKGVAEFSANDPAALLDELENKKEIAKAAIGELEKKKRAKIRDVQIFEGIEGVKRARNRALNYPAGETLYVIGATKLNSEPELEMYWRKFHKQREAKGINQKILFENSNDPTLKDAITWRNKLSHMETRSLPFNIDSPFWIDFIKDNVNIGIAGENPLTVSINSPGIAEGFKKYFDYFWNQRVSVKSGLPAVREAIYGMLEELNAGEEYLVFGALGKDYPTGFAPLYDKFHTDRIKKGVITKMLCYQESYQVLIDRFKRCGDTNLAVSQVKKYVSAPPIPMQINLYKGKTFFIIYDKTPMVIQFDQPVVFEAFRNYFMSAWNQRATTYEGVDQIKALIMESLAFGDYDVFAEGKKITDVLGVEFFSKWQQEKKRLGIKSRGIMNSIYKNQPTVTKSITQMKFIPGYAVPTVTLIFKDKLININFSDRPVAFLIDDAEIAESNRAYFNLLWKSGK